MLHSSSNTVSFQDKNQNYWQLASIQGAALGLPGILIGGIVASEIGPSGALTSILIGNIILWLIGLGIIQMSNSEVNAIVNIGDYLGKWSKFISALLIGTSFLIWFTLQSKSFSTLLGEVLLVPTRQELRLGAVMGVLTAILSMGGIKFIKWFNTISLPLLLLILTSLFFSSHHTKYANSYILTFSFSSILTIMMVTLPGIINLPTFFRHSRSKSHSFLALTMMTLFVALIQSFSVFLNISGPKGLASYNTILIIIFGIISLLSINIVNIYLASGVWEVITRRPADPRDYAAIGLVGTGAFAVLQALPAMTFLENSVNGFIACVGVILMIAFLIRIIVQHRPRKLERFISNSCWFIGCAASLISLIQNPEMPNRSILIGVGASALAFLVVIFVEETFWSFKNLSMRKSKL